MTIEHKAVEEALIDNSALQIVVNLLKLSLHLRTQLSGLFDFSQFGEHIGEYVRSTQFGADVGLGWLEDGQGSAQEGSIMG